jgi:trk system potassium uptake protein TrkH
MKPAALFHFSAGRILFLSFIFVILVGFLLLSLPQARTEEISLLNLFFTATSMTCVTGLQVVSIKSFTLFGHCVMLLLMQIGGIGLMTFSLFLFSLFSPFGLATTAIAGKLLELESLHKIKFFLGMIVIATLLIEAIGACLLYPFFASLMSPEKAIFYALFHSVSAFCNAGVSLFDLGLEGQSTQLFLLSVIGFLAFAGGVGFVVWHELIERFYLWLLSFTKRKQKKYALSLHTKMVLWTSLILIIAGAFIFALSEWNDSFASLEWYEKIGNALFLSITSRSAGFSTINLATTRYVTLLILMGLMFIGASPNSTGSGIKTTTVALIFATMSSIIKSRTHVECFGREIANEQIYKAITIVVLSCCWVLITASILLATETIGHTFLDLFFESFSAFTTTGFSRGITAALSHWGKITLIISMIVGRIGSLTLVLAIKKRKDKQMYRYPEERVLIG